MSIKRRTFLQGTMAGSVIGVAASAGLLSPRTVLAAWPQAAFDSENVAGAMKGLFSSETAADGDITIKAPDIAENGAVVPITVTSGIKGIETMALIVEKNPRPLAASFDMSPTTEGYVSTRVKMGKTSKLIAVVKAGGKLYSASKEVKVTIGGCGG